MTGAPRRTNDGVSYHDASYWETRFTSDSREVDGFEWLSSSSPLLSLLPPSLLLSSPPAQILHIGVGTSRLSLDLLRYWREHSPGDWKQRARAVVNVDFSPTSIAFQRTAERAFLSDLGELPNDDEEDGTLMQYDVVDLLNWSDVHRKLGAHRFTVVLDKSTTDSISTGSDVPLTHPPATTSGSTEEDKVHPALTQLAEMYRGKAAGVATTQVLGIHLGAVTTHDAIWLCHSYSSDRWQDILPSPTTTTAEHQNGTDDEESGVWPWTQTSKTPVPVASPDPNAPQINHYVYTLRRT